MRFSHTVTHVSSVKRRVLIVCRRSPRLFSGTTLVAILIILAQMDDRERHRGMPTGDRQPTGTAYPGRPNHTTSA